jgi:hypothetical protein
MVESGSIEIDFDILDQRRGRDPSTGAPPPAYRYPAVREGLEVVMGYFNRIEVVAANAFYALEFRRDGSNQIVGNQIVFAQAGHSVSKNGSAKGNGVMLGMTDVNRIPRQVLEYVANNHGIDDIVV